MTDNLFVLALAVLIGLTASTRLHRVRREAFAATEELKAALAEVRKLEGILRICSACKKICEEDGTWVALDEYVGKHTDARFSHVMCPDCMKGFYPDYSPPSAKP